MTGQERTLQSRVVQTAMEACRRVDPSVKVANMTEDADGTTYLRVRAGDAHSVASLQLALQEALPLASTSVTESMLDGTLEAELVVLNKRQEYLHARRLVSRERVPAYTIVLAWVFVCLGMGEWGALVRSIVSGPKDEL
jgi:hypothetical protein